MDKCIVCGSSEFKPIYNNTLLRCGGCSFVTANIKIGEENIKSIYTEKYFKGEEYLDYLKEKVSLQKNFQNRLNFIYKKIDKDAIKSVLEIGCSYGFFAELLNKEFGGSLNYIGFDIVKEAVDYGVKQLNQNLICGDYLDYITDENFTDVFMWDVIEHLKEPHKFIEKISDEICQGGRLYITTGDIDSLLSRFQKNRWRLIHTPTHIHFFSKKTIKILLEKYGFCIIDIKYPGIYRRAKSIFYLQFMLNKKYSKITKILFDLIPDNINVKINTYDIMFVIAKKIKV